MRARHRLAALGLVLCATLSWRALAAGEERVYVPLAFRPPAPTPTATPPHTGMVRVAAGEFRMGCDETLPDAECAPDELPLHTVSLDEYWIDAHEVTNPQYAACVSAGACRPPAHAESASGAPYDGEAGYADYPVVWVRWEDAAGYCTWAGGRLPTEAEWEKAARGPVDARTYPWGDTPPDCARANHYDALRGDYCVGDTTAVGAYPSGASPYGALDMAGNVWEWVADWYGSAYYAESPATNPPGPANGEHRILRGGSLASDARWVRVTARGVHPSSEGGADIGFRCAAGAAP